MHIGIATFAAHQMRTGVGTYIINLVNALLALGSGDCYLLFVSAENGALFPANERRMRKLVAPAGVNNTALRVLWEHTALPLKLRAHDIDVFHGPTFITPLFSRRPLVVTIHDMTWFTHAEHHTPVKRRYFQTLIPLVARKAKKIIAVTENTRRDILRILQLPEEKVVTVHSGVDHSFQPVSDSEWIATVKRRYRIPGNFVLFVGLIEPRKNLVRLVEAFHALKKQGAPHVLVLAGAPGWGYSKVVERIHQLQLDQQVLLPGAIAQGDLPALFSAADLFVYPSLYEGFGLPPLEAMACSVPVVTSNVSSLPEVVGDAALLVDPLNVRELAAAMWTGLTDHHVRAQLRARGVAQARRFTWAETARQTLHVYREACGKG